MPDVGALGGRSEGLGVRARALLECTPDERAGALRQMASLMAAAHAELLDLVAASDAAVDWEADGATDMSAWLVGTCGLTRHHAREWVAAGHALQTMPALRQAYAGGAMSWDQLRPAMVLAADGHDDEVAASAPGYSASRLARLARQRRGRPDGEARDARERRDLSLRLDCRRGGWSLSGFLPEVEGAAVHAVLRSLAESIGPDPGTGEWDRIGRRMSDALVHLVVGDERPRGVATTVVVHADAARWDDELRRDGAATIGDAVINPEGLLRLMCDAPIECALHDEDGRTVGIGRTRRTIPGWLARQVERRDGTCRFPGCDRPIRQIHHVRHWADGGPTNLANLLGLCWHHHDLVHDGGWRMEGHPEAEIGFVSPAGRRARSRPQPLRPEIRHLLGAEQSG